MTKDYVRYSVLKICPRTVVFMLFLSPNKLCVFVTLYFIYQILEREWSNLFDSHNSNILK